MTASSILSGVDVSSDFFVTLTPILSVQCESSQKSWHQAAPSHVRRLEIPRLWAQPLRAGRRTDSLSCLWMRARSLHRLISLLQWVGHARNVRKHSSLYPHSPAVTSSAPPMCPLNTRAATPPPQCTTSSLLTRTLLHISNSIPPRMSPTPSCASSPPNMMLLFPNYPSFIFFFIQKTWYQSQEDKSEILPMTWCIFVADLWWQYVCTSPNVFFLYRFYHELWHALLLLRIQWWVIASLSNHNDAHFFHCVKRTWNL